MFTLQDEHDEYFISAMLIEGSKYALMTPTATLNSVFMYNSKTLQIFQPLMRLCLDDGGQESLYPNTNAFLSFAACDSSSINQQFVYRMSDQRILNPNWANNIVLNRNGTVDAVPGAHQLLLWLSDGSPTNYDEMFKAYEVCGFGKLFKRVRLW